MPGAHCAVVCCGRHFSKIEFPNIRFYKIPIGKKDEAWAKQLIAIVNRVDKGFNPCSLSAQFTLNQSYNIKVSTSFATVLYYFFLGKTDKSEMSEMSEQTLKLFHL